MLTSLQRSPLADQKSLNKQAHVNEHLRNTSSPHQAHTNHCAATATKSLSAPVLHCGRSSDGGLSAVPTRAPLREVLRQAALARLASRHTRAPAGPGLFRAAHALLAGASPRLPAVFADASELLHAAHCALKQNANVGSNMLVEGARVADLVAHVVAVLLRQLHVQHLWPDGGTGAQHIVLVTGVSSSFPSWLHGARQGVLWVLVQLSEKSI